MSNDEDRLEPEPSTILRPLVLLLASSALDASSSFVRNDKISTAQKLVKEEFDARLELSDGLGLEAAKSCYSSHAQKRIAALLVSAIKAQAEGDDAAKRAHSISEGLVHALSRLLLQSQGYDLIKSCANSLLALKEVAATNVLEALLKVIKSSSDGLKGYSGEYGPAISLASSILVTALPKSGRAFEWKAQMADLFLKCTLSASGGSGSGFASASNIKMCKLFLSNLSQDQFDSSIAPILGLKLRANPESVLETAESIVSALGESIDVTSHLEGDTRLLSAGLKQMRSTKAEMRELASSMLASLALLSNGAFKVGGPLEIVVANLCEALSSKKVTATSLTQADQRAGAYKLLTRLGAFLLKKVEDNLLTEGGVLEGVSNVVLSSLSIALEKEISGTEEIGYDALLNWMLLSKRIASKGKGYSNAVEYFAKPALDAGKPGSTQSNEFRFRLGSLFTSSQSDDFIESVIVDIFQQEAKVGTGLQAVVDSAIRKHGNSNIVPQIDGLIATFLLLINSSASSAPLSQSLVKLLSAGSSPSGSSTSFLYSKAMTDATATDAIVGRILHQTIALYCKLQFKETDGTSSGLVCLTKNGSVSAAAHALACWIANPHPHYFQRASQASVSVHALTLKSVITYSPAAAKASDAIVAALFAHVNALSLHFDESIKSLNKSRELRERYDPVNENYAKLPVLRGDYGSNAGHTGFDPNTVRRIAHMLTESIADVAALSKAIILSHAGATLKLFGSRQRAALVTNTLVSLREVVIPFIKHKNQVNLLKELASVIVTYASSHSMVVSNEKEDSTPDDNLDGVERPRNNGSEATFKKITDKKKDLEQFKLEGNADVSRVVHDSAVNLITTLGILAGNYDPESDSEGDETAPFKLARDMCVDEISTRLAANLNVALQNLESIDSSDMALYKTPDGVLFKDCGRESTDGNSSEKKQARAVRGRKQKGDFGAESEFEEWERQLKAEIERKQKEASANSSAAILTPEEKTMLEEQTLERKRLANIIDKDFSRTLNSIRSLCLSEIEVGNACLPTLSLAVIATVISQCDAMTCVPSLKNSSFETIRAIASCVYEINETHASTIAHALAISYRTEAKTNSTDDFVKRSVLRSEDVSRSVPSLSVVALPSPCASAACVIFEMEDYNDCLSGPSFWFLFPIIRAALTGPRTTPGCEASLQILHRHTTMLAGNGADGTVRSLRKDMANAVLELLTHDRSQKFTNPTPFEALVACYRTDDANDSSKIVLNSAELSPLLGDSGALGGKNCRLGSMMALSLIAGEHPSLVKNNPLVENRIWVNCFEANERVQIEARRAWSTAYGVESLDGASFPSPSKTFAAALLPLLSHADASIASAAAVAFAHGTGMHPDSLEKNVVRLLSAYIDAYPTAEISTIEPSKHVIASAAQEAKPKAKISTGLPAKKPVKKTVVGGSSIAQLTTTKATKKKPSKSTLAALTPKLNERTFDRDLLDSQFTAEVASKKDNIEKDSPSKVSTRLGILRVVAAFTEPSANVQLELPVLKLLTAFLMAFGLADVNEEVRSAATNATRDVVASKGASDESIAFLLPHFESVLKTGMADESCLGLLKTNKVLRDVAASDRRKEGAVVALGAAAIHLKDDEDADKIDTTIDMLLSALDTPSKEVQSSVALCLSKLMKKGRTHDRLESILTTLLRKCLHGDTLASRCGAAYGISAVVKGSGIASLKKHDIVKQLEEACTSGSSSSKEGALFAVELLCDRLGLLFEPYVIVLLPALLKAFSDSSNHVRAAAASTSGKIMSKLSAHGVKLVMPAVLSAFDEPEWRTKQASIHMLGAMSHCAPKQLASCLPKVVPKLTEAFSDTHPKVKGSAEEALDEISKVIRNPEISSISTVLLKALTDPATGTVRALESLIETEFLHAIDAPSLALIVPVLHRGLRDRAANTKRYGALIAGNICTMINDPRDFVPYLPILLPDLKAVLLDPIPDVRSTSAKALGSLTRSLGESTFPELRPWLIQTLEGENGTSAERSGAAQGLTEVLVAGGASLTESVMLDEILPLRSHPKAYTREGVLWVLTFLPSALGQAFSPLIDASLPALLGGLSDESEPVRDVAMRAGRVLVRSHGKAHIDKILPSLETGLNDEDYRIRVASLTLLGDLLSMIGGTKVVKGEGDTQEDVRQAERAQAQIALVLGPEKRKRVLSSLYLRRSDTTHAVRQSAIQVWKTVVSVTPRTLREILDVLVGQIVTALASGHSEHTLVAGRCLGDIVKKLGDTVLPEVIPVLRDALYRGDEYTRRGVCVGLTEVIGCSSKEQINKHLPVLVKAVQDALCDEDEGVRQMAASCFQSLHALVGSRALDEVVPVLLFSMGRSDNNEKERARAVNGLTEILRIRSREILPYLVPRLINAPITKSHAYALASIAKVTGDSLHIFFSSIIPGLCNELAGFFNKVLNDEEKEREESIRLCAHAVCGSVEETGLNWLIGEIASKCSSDKEGLRKETCWMLQVVVEERKDRADFYDLIPIIFREFLHRLNDDSHYVLMAANLGLFALSTHVPAEVLVDHIEFIRNIISSMVSDARRRKGGVGDGEFLLPGFNMQKGLEPLMPIYQRGILYGDSNIREVSAAGLGELIALTESKFLAGPLIIKMTGPLLRIVGDRNPSAVKIAIIQTLGSILIKGGPALRAFVPQFQTTFVKALSDPSRQVRVEAISALALLMPLSTRLDPLIKELVSSSLGKAFNTPVESAGLVSIQTATLEALAVVLTHGEDKAKLPESIPSALDAGKELLMHEDEGVREGAAKVIGSACALLGVETAAAVVKELLINDSASNSSDVKHGIACACYRILASFVGKALDEDTFAKIKKTVVSLMIDEKSSVREAACVTIGAILGRSSNTIASLKDVEPTILKCMDSKESMEVLRSVAKGLIIAVQMKPDVFEGKIGLPILDAALTNAMSGSQRVQLAYNDFLWLALDVKHGDAGLEKFTDIAMFDSARTMKNLHSKVLVRIKSVKEE